MPRCTTRGVRVSPGGAQGRRPHSAATSFQDASPGDSPPATPPASPVSSGWQPFPEEDSDSPQFRRRAHTFSHPPSSARRRITFQNGRSQSVRSPLLRQSCLEVTRWVRMLPTPHVHHLLPFRYTSLTLVPACGSCFCAAQGFIYLLSACLLCLRSFVALQ